MALGKWLLLVGAVLVALLAVSCGDDEENGAEPTATTEEAVASPEAADPAELFRQYVDALNRGDVDGVMALFADDAVFVDSACLPLCVGKDAIRNLTEFGVAENVAATFTSSEASGNTATGIIVTESDVIEAAGVERVIVTFTTEVKGAEIVFARLEIDRRDKQSGAFVAWAVTNAISVDLGPGRDADQSPGLAKFTPTTGDRTAVFVSVEPGPAGVPQPIHIHEGTCGNLGAVVHPLPDIAGGKTAPVLDVSLAELRTGNFAINAHRSAEEIGVYVACGDIPPP